MIASTVPMTTKWLPTACAPLTVQSNVTRESRSTGMAAAASGRTVKSSRYLRSPARAHSRERKS